jgi:hypothetical protein
MPYAPVDINNIKLDQAPDYANPAVRDAAIVDIYGDKPAFVPVDISQITLDNTEPPKETTFLGDMRANAENAVQSGRDLLSGNFEDIGRTVSTPKTTALTDKVFPKGYEGGFLAALDNARRNTSASDWSGALLEKFGNTPEGKALSVIGGLNPVYNAAGTAISRYVNPAIEEATGIHPDNLALLELAAAPLGLKNAKNVKDPTAQLINRVSNSMGTASGKPAKAIIPTAEQARTQAGNTFKAAEAQGGALAPHLTDKWIDEAANVTPKTQAGRIVFSEETPSSKIVQNLQSGMRGKQLSLSEAMEIDSGLTDRISGHVDIKGKLDAEGKKLLDIQQSLRDTIEKASPNDIVGGAKGFETWKQAKAEWSKAARLADIERIIQRSEGADNPTTVLKNGFRTLRDNPKRMNGFSKDEKAAIRHAAKTGMVGGGLKFMGSRIISSLAGAAGGAAGGGPIGAAAGAAAGALAGTPFRLGAEALQRGRAQSVLETITMGKPAPGSALSTLATQGTKALPGAAESSALGGSIEQLRKAKEKRISR